MTGSLSRLCGKKPDSSKNSPEIAFFPNSRYNLVNCIILILSIYLIMMKFEKKTVEDAL